MKALSYWRRMFRLDKIKPGCANDIADRMERLIPSGWWLDQDIRRGYLVRDARELMKSIGSIERGKRTRAFERTRGTSAGEQGPYKQRELLTLTDYRDVLQACRETVTYNEDKGRRTLAEAVEKGHTCLQGEFPEFD